MSRKLPIGVIVVFMLIAIATLGVAYGAWEQTITVNGTVSTGRFDVQFDSAAVTGGCTLNAGDVHNLVVTWADTYPGQTCRVEFIVKNTGTVPAKFGTYTKTGTAPTWLLIDVPAPEDMVSGVTLNPGQSTALSHANFKIGPNAPESSGAISGSVSWTAGLP